MSWLIIDLRKPTEPRWEEALNEDQNPSTTLYIPGKIMVDTLGATIGYPSGSIIYLHESLIDEVT